MVCAEGRCAPEFRERIIPSTHCSNHRQSTVAEQEQAVQDPRGNSGLTPSETERSSERASEYLNPPPPWDRISRNARHGMYLWNSTSGIGILVERRIAGTPALLWAPHQHLFLQVLLSRHCHRRHLLYARSRAQSLSPGDSSSRHHARRCFEGHSEEECQGEWGERVGKDTGTPIIATSCVQFPSHSPVFLLLLIPPSSWPTRVVICCRDVFFSVGRTLRLVLVVDKPLFRFRACRHHPCLSRNRLKSLVNTLSTSQERFGRQNAKEVELRRAEHK